MKLWAASVLHPSYHHVWLWHLSVRGESKADPSSGPHAHGEADILSGSVKAPEESVVRTEFLTEAVRETEVVWAITRDDKWSKKQSPQ